MWISCNANKISLQIRKTSLFLKFNLNVLSVPLSVCRNDLKTNKQANKQANREKTTLAWFSLNWVQETCIGLSITMRSGPTEQIQKYISLLGAEPISAAQKPVLPRYQSALLDTYIDCTYNVHQQRSGLKALEERDALRLTLGRGEGNADMIFLGVIFKINKGLSFSQSLLPLNFKRFLITEDA